MIRILLALATLTSALVTYAADVIPDAEYHVSPDAIKAFSSGGMKVQLCDGCQEEQLGMANKVFFYDRNNPITLKRATELYLEKPYDVVFIGANRAKKTLNYVVFGGIDELAPFAWETQK